MPPLLSASAALFLTISSLLGAAPKEAQQTVSDTFEQVQPVKTVAKLSPIAAPSSEGVSSSGSCDLAYIKQAESGGDYQAVNPNGHYGAYQFDQSTWESNGGSGNPAEASPEEQDRVAANLYAARGSQPWSVC